MITALLYVLFVAGVAGLLFALAALVFGRAEPLPPLPPGTTPTTLPKEGIAGDDVRALKFQQTLRGYKPAEVDWALDQLAAEIDSLRAQLSQERSVK